MLDGGGGGRTVAPRVVQVPLLSASTTALVPKLIWDIQSFVLFAF